MASIKHSDMNEEYLVYYSMSCNMMIVHLPTFLFFFLCTCLCSVIAWLMLGYLILSTNFLYKVYRRHVKHYVEIIVAEYDFQQRHNLTSKAEL